MTAAQRFALSRPWLDMPIEAIRIELGKALVAYVEAKQQRLPLDEFRSRQDRLDALLAAWPERFFAHHNRPLIVVRTLAGDMIVTKREKPKGPRVRAKGGAS